MPDLTSNALDTFIGNNMNSARDRAVHKRNACVCVLVIVLVCATRPLIGLVTHPDRGDTLNSITLDYTKQQRIRNNQSESVRVEAVNGIDVSHYDGDIDWRTVVGSGIEFAFIKASQGTHFIDPMYKTNRQALVDNQLDFGVYHFYQPNSDAVEQAKHFLSVAGVKHILPPVLDIEISGGEAADTLVAGARAWLEYVEEKTGCKPMIYTDTNYWNTHLGDHLDEYPLWIAEYRQTLTLPEARKHWVFWQHSAYAKVLGVSGSVDSNVFNGDKSQMNAVKCQKVS